MPTYQGIGVSGTTIMSLDPRGELLAVRNVANGPKKVVVQEENIRRVSVMPSIVGKALPAAPPPQGLPSIDANRHHFPLSSAKDSRPCTPPPRVRQRVSGTPTPPPSPPKARAKASNLPALPSPKTRFPIANPTQKALAPATTRLSTSQAPGIPRPAIRVRPKSLPQRPTAQHLPLAPRSPPLPKCVVKRDLFSPGPEPGLHRGIPLKPKVSPCQSPKTPVHMLPLPSRAAPTLGDVCPQVGRGSFVRSRTRA